ncbi:MULTISPECIES: hypothetical protein [Rhizobium]|uniref:Uncharacterized protein n=1 Tax=Rhizobium esperanzae TaxID=1967781 RepID=A0A7W6XXX3_9HYPH|nr:MULTISPECIES: hypothetical protein [Rhizobium]MBB4442251.1 hypothetical protein [Rhizobium esperanzae]MDH6205022.1 hypothetical protein [Rhizobium leguminosarum]
MRKFAQAQTTFGVGEPTFAPCVKRMRKFLPLTPVTKCGMPLVRNAAAMKWPI